MTNSNYSQVSHCIFDMDGLLLDTEKLYTEAFTRICAPHGKLYTWAHKAKIMGFKPSEVGAAVIEMLNLPITPQQFNIQAQIAYKELFPNAKLLPGAEKLLCHLKAHKIPIALATSSSKESYELKTQNIKHIFDLFDHRVLGGTDPEIKRGKPSPDIFLVAARRFSDKPDPAKCLVFEDAPNGVKAAISARMQVVMVPDPNLPKNLTTEANLVLNSLEDFPLEEFGLPPFSA